jgi:hypothetical protein
MSKLISLELNRRDIIESCDCCRFGVNFYLKNGSNRVLLNHNVISRVANLRIHAIAVTELNS